jgi:hypothetical protein
MNANLVGLQTGHKVVIDSKVQTLTLFRGDAVLFEAPVSTSRYGLGFEIGSHKTPIGKFRICEKIGANMPAATVFKVRRPVPEPVDWSFEPDLITTRILLQDGIEAYTPSWF